MNCYIKTSYMYLLPCSSFLVLVSIILNISLSERDKEWYFYFAIFYIGLVLICFFQTWKNRKQMKEIMKNGKCMTGIVDYLQEVRREVTFTRAGTMEEFWGYQIVVKVLDEYGGSREFCSEVISCWRKNRISKKVKVYEYFGDSVVWFEKSKVRMHYEIKKTNEVMKIDFSRALLVFINRILVLYTVIIVSSCIGNVKYISSVTNGMNG